MAVSFADRVVAGPDVLIRVVGDESVLLNVKTETYFGLDAMGSRVWEALTQSASIQSACDALLAEYEVPPEHLRRELEAFVAELMDSRLIAIVPRPARDE